MVQECETKAEVERKTESEIAVIQCEGVKMVGGLNGKNMCEGSTGEYIYQKQGF